MNIERRGVSGSSATICTVLNLLSVVGSVPVVGMAYQARTWGIPRENLGVFFLVFFGGAVLAVQLLVLLANGVVAIVKWNGWTARGRRVFLITLPLGGLLSGAAMYCGLPPWE